MDLIKTTRTANSAVHITYNYEPIEYVHWGIGDVHAYVNTTMTSCDFIEPPNPTSKSIVYRQLFDEIKAPIY